MSRKFLIGQLGCFGDCLFATPLAKQIKNDYPDSHVTWAVAGKYKSILALNPYVDSIWEISVSDNNYSGESWTKFETEALQRKSDGEFDEIIFSQIPPLNWIKYTGTIRNTILSSYGKPITVPIEPTIKLSENEIENVKLFSEKYKLGDFKNVILFECAPGSGQSTVNTEFAIKVANEILKKRNV